MKTWKKTRNRKAIVYSFLLRLLIAILFIAFVGGILAKLFKNSEQANRSFYDLDELIKELAANKDRPDDTGTMAYNLDKDTALFGFSPTASSLRFFSFREGTSGPPERLAFYHLYAYNLPRPDLCDIGKSCVCLCRGDFETGSWSAKDLPEFNPDFSMDVSCPDDDLQCIKYDDIEIIDEIQSSRLVPNIDRIAKYPQKGGFFTMRKDFSLPIGGLPGEPSKFFSIVVEKYDKKYFGICRTGDCISDEMKDKIKYGEHFKEVQKVQEFEESTKVCPDKTSTPETLTLELASGYKLVFLKGDKQIKLKKDDKDVYALEFFHNLCDPVPNNFDVTKLDLQLRFPQDSDKCCIYIIDPSGTPVQP